MPAVLTLFLLSFVISGTDQLLAPVIIRMVQFTGIILPDNFSIPGLGFTVIVLLIFLIGLVTTNFFGRKVVASGDFLLNKIPLVRTIYISIKKIVETVSQTQTPSFKEVVLLDYPRPGLKGIGVVSCDTKEEIAECFKEKMVNVFVPTTPNPTTGFLVMVPKEKVIRLDMPINDSFKMIFSVGLFNPMTIGKGGKAS